MEETYRLSRRSLISNKKGDITDMVIFLILLFILGFGFFIFTFVVPSITDGLREGGLNTTSEGESAITQLEKFGSVQIQRGFFLVFVGLMISTLISAFLVRTHPIFLFLYIIFLILSVFLGTYLGNAYNDLRNIPTFADQLASQTLFNLVFDNLLVILIAVGALSIIIVFAKFSSFFRGNQGQL